MKLSFKVVERDLGWRALQKAWRTVKPGGNYVKIGLLGGKKSQRPGEPIDNVALGLVHEFGSPANNIPARSFIRAPFRAKQREYLKMLKQLLATTFTRRKFELREALAIMGEKIAADFKESAPGTPPPNAPATLRRKLSLTRRGSKGDPRSLVGTGRMIDSITYEVVIGGGK